MEYHKNSKIARKDLTLQSPFIHLLGTFISLYSFTEEHSFKEKTIPFTEGETMSFTYL